jgi:2-amino-4-hydroxy-6-hydroxymethyldihydropteridine diphosphokinase / dihydropteroate synthase
MKILSTLRICPTLSPNLVASNWCASTLVSPQRHVSKTAIHSRHPASRRLVSGQSRLYNQLVRPTAINKMETNSQSQSSHCGCGSSMAAAARPPTKKIAYIALGSNLGDRIAWIEQACQEMTSRGIHIKRTSSLWETEPMYVLDQERFVNGACEVSNLD